MGKIKDCEIPTAFQRVPAEEVKKEKIIIDDDDEEQKAKDDEKQKMERIKDFEFHYLRYGQMSGENVPHGIGRKIRILPQYKSDKKIIRLLYADQKKNKWLPMYMAEG